MSPYDTYMNWRFRCWKIVLWLWTKCLLCLYINIILTLKFKCSLCNQFCLFMTFTRNGDDNFFQWFNKVDDGFNTKLNLLLIMITLNYVLEGLNHAWEQLNHVCKELNHAREGLDHVGEDLSASLQCHHIDTLNINFYH